MIIYKKEVLFFFKPKNKNKKIWLKKEIEDLIDINLLPIIQQELKPVTDFL